MKKALAALFVISSYCVNCQDFNTMAGDWIRVDVEYANGDRVPNGHNARAFVRYHFTKKEVFLVSGNTLLTSYTRAGNQLRIGPIQSFIIERYSDSNLTLVEAHAADPIRYFLIPTDSFQVSGRLGYPFEVVGTDTVYKAMPGIEPIYPKGHDELNHSIVAGIAQQAAFDFSYVVKKDGTIGDVTVNASTKPKMNKRLIQLIKKSSGKWIPATYKGKSINVRQEDKIAMSF
jgi:hypothetical protein